MVCFHKLDCLWSRQLGESSMLSPRCLRSSFMLKFRTEVIMLSQESVITRSCLISSFGCGYSYILIIFKMQRGRVFDKRWPAFISFIESPTTTRLII